MRRWRVVVIDDNPEGSLEAVLLSPWVLFDPLPPNATKADLIELTQSHRLNAYLPLDEGETYADPVDADFQITDLEQRRHRLGRPLMIDVERNFARAWDLVSNMGEDPPDIIFLDVLFDPKSATSSEAETIISEIQRADIIAGLGRPTAREVMGRGGLFLLGKLLRARGDVSRMPLVVLYSASRDVQVDFRPFAYASNGRFDVVAKDLLRNDNNRRRDVFHRRIRDYLSERMVASDHIRESVELLATPRAIEGDHDTLVAAFRRNIGDGWCFGSMFVAETVAYLAAEPARRSMVLDDLNAFLAPFITHSRSFVDFMQSSPARLYSHNIPIKFAKRPDWAKDGTGTVVGGGLRVTISHRDTSDDPTVAEAFRTAVKRLPAAVRDALESAFYDANEITPLAGTPRLDKFVASAASYDPLWQKVLGRCRLPSPAKNVASFLKFIGREHVTVELPADTTTSRRLKDFELVLMPSDRPMKEPLSGLLKAIVEGAVDDDGRTTEVRAVITAQSSPALFEISLSHNGRGFEDVRYYDPRTKTGDLSAALEAALPWFDVEIQCGGEIRRPLAPPGVINRTTPTTGTTFLIRIPAYTLEES